MSYIVIVLISLSALVGYHWFITETMNKKMDVKIDCYRMSQKHRSHHSIRDVVETNMIYGIRQEVETLKKNVENLQHKKDYRVTIDGVDVVKLTDDGKPIYETDTLIAIGLEMTKPLPLDYDRAQSLALEFNGKVHGLYDDKEIH